MSDEQETLSHHPSPITRDERSLSALRTSLRQQRRSLSLQMRTSAASALARRLIRLQLLRKGRSIAVYNAIDGEIDLSQVIRHARQAGCALYAPHIVDMRTRKMEFVALTRRVEKFSDSNRINPRQLDVVLVPLVAFDAAGWRLGFGAGFYDRKFAFMRRKFLRKPLLIGVGYDFQRVPQLRPQRWDVRLRSVVTERRVYRC